MKVMRAEAFGPLVSVVPFADFGSALTAVDDSEFGLQAGVFTPSLARAMLAVQRLNVGGAIIPQFFASKVNVFSPVRPGSS